jgi:hypothetical protein
LGVAAVGRDLFFGCHERVFLLVGMVAGCRGGEFGWGR